MSATTDPSQTPESSSAAARRSGTAGRDARARCDARVRTDGLSPAAGAAPTSDTAARPQTRSAAVGSIRRRLLGAVIPAPATATLLLAVPPLRGVAPQIDAMNPV